jgi:hypothetical protein
VPQFKSVMGPYLAELSPGSDTFWQPIRFLAAKDTKLSIRLGFWQAATVSSRATTTRSLNWIGATFGPCCVRQSLIRDAFNQKGVNLGRSVADRPDCFHSI